MRAVGVGGHGGALRGLYVAASLASSLTYLGIEEGEYAFQLENVSLGFTDRRSRDLRAFLRNIPTSLAASLKTGERFWHRPGETVPFFTLEIPGQSCMGEWILRDGTTPLTHAHALADDDDGAAIETGRIRRALEILQLDPLNFVCLRQMLRTSMGASAYAKANNRLTEAERIIAKYPDHQPIESEERRQVQRERVQAAVLLLQKHLGLPNLTMNLEDGDGFWYNNFLRIYAIKDALEYLSAVQKVSPTDADSILSLRLLDSEESESTTC